MDFKGFLLDFLATCILVLQRIILLILYPYRTMRNIALKGDFYQTGVIISLSFIYFLVAYSLRGWIWWSGPVFLAFMVLFTLTVYFFYFLSRPYKEGIVIHRFIFTFSYTLIPTLFWFYSNLLLFIVLPPPRSMSILGKGFSIFFIAYSVSLLVWKMILVYLAIRFSSRLGLFRILYMLLLYIVIFIPLSLIMYYLKIFRIPFI